MEGEHNRTDQEPPEGIDPEEAVDPGGRWVESFVHGTKPSRRPGRRQGSLPGVSPARPTSYTTLGAPFRYEPDKVKGSRFIACVAPASNEEEAQAFLAAIKAEFDDARHWCFAWRLGETGDLTRSGDDGEPSGSAGRPILLQLEGHGVTDVAAVVVRYFGGVKLGVGGLMRAYGGAAGQALDRAELLEVPIRETLRCTHDYGDSGAVAGVLSARGLVAEDADYGSEVSFSIRVGVDEVEDVARALGDATAGRLRVEKPGDKDEV